MKIMINTDLKHILIGILSIVFLYLLFYTNYIIHNNNGPTSSPSSSPSPSVDFNLYNNQEIEKHVRFNTEQNQEIIYDP